MNKENITTEQAYLESYEKYNDAIFRYCLFETSNREVAIDITQDTFTKVWEYVASGKQVENMRAFLYRVAGNLVIDYRRKKKATSLDSMLEDGFDVAHNEIPQTIDKIDGEGVRKIVDAIPEKYKDVIIMRFVEDMSVKEISQITGESENNISVRIHRGLEKIKSLYEEKSQKIPSI